MNYNINMLIPSEGNLSGIEFYSSSVCNQLISEITPDNYNFIITQSFKEGAIPEVDLFQSSQMMDNEDIAIKKLGVYFSLSLLKNHINNSDLIWDSDVDVVFDTIAKVYLTLTEYQISLSDQNVLINFFKENYHDLMIGDYVIERRKNVFESVSAFKEFLEIVDNEISVSLNNTDVLDLTISGWLNNEQNKKDFPKTINRTVEMLKPLVETQESVASAVLDFSSEYAKEEWGKEYLLVALKYPSVANKFLNWSEFPDEETEPNWVEFRKEPWYLGALEIAKKTVQIYKELAEKGLYYEDPFKTHPYKLTSEKRKLSNYLFEYLQTVDASENSNFQELINLVNQVCIEIETRLKMTQVDSAEINSCINGNESISIKPIKEFITSSLCDFVVNTEERIESIYELDCGDKLKVLRINLNKLIDAYINSYDVDIPIYEVLYSDLNKLIEGGNSTLEIYLGRDGIYAYLGRRASFLGILHSLRGEERKKYLESSDQVRLYKPKYLVYPRFYRDYLPLDTKRKYLSSSGISSDNDLHFYDTGYVGTIPEQILQILGVPEEDINSRIHLLSAEEPTRKVPGLDDISRGTIVQQIEHNYKDVNSSTGLIYDISRNRFFPAEEPTDPLDQLCFSFIRQSITRHFWYKSKSKLKSE